MHPLKGLSLPYKRSFLQKLIREKLKSSDFVNPIILCLMSIFVVNLKTIFLHREWRKLSNYLLAIVKIWCLSMSIKGS